MAEEPEYIGFLGWTLFDGDWAACTEDEDGAAANAWCRLSPADLIATLFPAEHAAIPGKAAAPS